MQPEIPTQGALFADIEAPALGPAPLSYGRRLTARRRAALARGVHPVSGFPLFPAEQGRRCADCRNLFVHGRSSQDYWKCELNATRGAATDIRRTWPACTAFRAKEGAPTAVEHAETA